VGVYLANVVDLRMVVPEIALAFMPLTTLSSHGLYGRLSVWIEGGGPDERRTSRCSQRRRGGDTRAGCCRSKEGQHSALCAGRQ
jgi:hypothetical protein